MGFQDFIDRYVFPPTGPEYSSSEGRLPSPPSYGIRPPEPVPTFDGSDHVIDPSSRKVNPAEPEVDVHPDADPVPLLDKKQAKDVQPYLGRVHDAVLAGHLPGTEPFYKAVGIHTSQMGVPNLRSMPFGSVIHAFHSGSQNLKRLQDAADTVGTSIITPKVQEMLTGPNKVGEALSLGMQVPLNSNQMKEGVIPTGQYGPGNPVPNPDAELTLPQQLGITSPQMKGIASGNLIKDPETGQLITSWQASARENPQFLDADSAQNAIEKLPYTPKGFIIPKDAKGRVPNAVFDSLISKFSTPASQLNPTLGVDRESVARRVTSQALGYPLSYNQMLAQAPHLAPQVDKELQDYIRTTTSNKVDATSDTRRAQPVGGLVSNYARLNKYGEIEKPSDPKLSEDQLNNQGYVNVMHLKPEVEAYNSLNVIQQDMSKLRNYADELFKAGPGAFSLAKQGLGVKVNKLTEKGKLTNIRGSNGKPLTRGQLATIYEREVNSMLEYYGRNLRGLRGAATEGDVNRMRDSFANEFNSEETKNKLFEDLQTFISNVQQAGRRTIFGAPNSQRMAPAERYEQLKKEGKLTDEQIYDQLHKEGYREGS